MNKEQSNKGKSLNEPAKEQRSRKDKDGNLIVFNNSNFLEFAKKVK